MASESFCTVCQRTVYSTEEDETEVCPVCSTPLLAANENVPPAP